jgi:hypothetical protein
MALLDKVKVACEISVNDQGINGELTDLIAAAKQELIVAGIIVPENEDNIPELVAQAIKLYCRMNFRSPANFEQLRTAYDRTVGLLRNADDYIEEA